MLSAVPLGGSGVAVRMQLAALQALWTCGVQAQAGRRARGPSGLRFEVVPAPVDVPAALRLAPVLSAALGRPVDVRQAGRAVVVDVALPTPEALSLGVLPPTIGLAVPLGMDGAGRPVVLDLGAPGTAHALVAGATGAGKSNVMRLLARGLTTAADVRLVAVDPDAATFPDVLTVSVDGSDRRAAVSWVREQLERAAGGADVRPVVLFVDEAAEVLRDGAIRADVQAIAARGRKWGCHVILATSDTSADSLPRSIIGNIRARIVGAVVDHHAAAQAAGRAGAERLERVGTFVVHPGGCTVAVPWVNAEAWAGVASAAAWCWRAAPVLETVPPEPEGIPEAVWGWIRDVTRDGSRVPGIGRIAGRARVGKAKAGVWREAALAWDGWDRRMVDDDSKPSGLGVPGGAS